VGCVWITPPLVATIIGISNNPFNKQQTEKQIKHLANNPTLREKKIDKRIEIESYGHEEQSPQILVSQDDSERVGDIFQIE
jgi:hypothetical protein